MPEFTEILIDECIKKYNYRNELEGNDRLTRIILGRKIYPNRCDNVINTYLSNLSKGKKNCDVATIKKFLKELKVSITELTEFS